MDPNNNTGGSNKFAVPFAIIIAGGLIAGSLYFSNIKSAEVAVQKQQAEQKTETVTTSADMLPVTSADHILGNPKAQLLFVEYSDTECPYCKMFHTTLQRMMAEYGKDGKVAWVYRHFPIDQLHPKARKEAEATECANELGGTEKFWAFTDAIYSATNSNNSLDDGVYNLPKTVPTDPSGNPAYVQKKPRSADDAGQLSDIAKSIGLDITAFNKCLASGKYTAKIEASYQDAVKAGGRGTPNSIIISKDGTKTPIQGAYPYENLKTILDALLKS
jgi:protein-disulfide isomerase